MKFCASVHFYVKAVKENCSQAFCSQYKSLSFQLHRHISEIFLIMPQCPLCSDGSVLEHELNSGEWALMKSC